MSGDTESINRQITKLLDDLEVPDELREDLFQEAWVAHLEGKVVRTTIIKLLEREKEYKKVFGR